MTSDAADAIPALISSTGQLCTVSSLRSKKDNIAEIDPEWAESVVRDIVPYSFTMKANGPDSPLQYGMIVDQVEAVAPGLIAHDANGDAETIKYQHLPAILWCEVRRLQAEVARLSAMMEAK